MHHQSFNRVACGNSKITPFVCVSIHDFDPTIVAQRVFPIIVKAFDPKQSNMTGVGIGLPPAALSATPHGA